MSNESRAARKWTVIVAKKDPFSLIYAPLVHSHFGALDAKYDSLIRRKIEEQLTYEPDVETRNRNPFKHQPPFKRNGNYGSVQTIGSVFSTRSTRRLAKCASSRLG